MKFPLASVIIGVFLVACEKVEVKRSYYPNGALKEEWEATKDQYGQEIKQGVFKQFYENKQLKLEANYLEGKKHGMQKTYYENGKQKSEENYLFGKLSGRKKSWSVDGNLEMEADYLDGKQHGIFKRFYPGGGVHHEVQFRNGMKHGTHRLFDAQGNVEKMSWFQDGQEVEAPPDSTVASSQGAVDTAAHQADALEPAAAEQTQGRDSLGEPRER